jgi:hypothetical protein
MQYLYDLTEEQIKLIQERCNEIIEAFVPDRFIVYPDTLYVVSHYNDQFPDEVIDGNIYEYAMSIPLDTEQPQEEA